MAKSKTKKTTTHKIFPKLRKYAALLAALVLIIALIGNKVNNNAKRKQEKANFVALEQTLTDFSAQVEQALGKPLQQETKSFCDRTGVKFGEGELFCGTRTGANYAVSPVVAKKYNNELKILIQKQGRFTDFSQRDIIEHPKEWSQNVYFSVPPTFSCSLRLVYDDISLTSIGPYIGDSKPGTFGYLLRCTEYSSQQYYPTGQ